ncbi:hypothetical protein F5878DRAFT_667994 [Lentinula raphanica]|uniref:BED-type domain-containing protein n=1 Tax=Lentinula raphanica TaxID=153919 RepID=A0AA38NUV5_9AGAR|nr:hypothetical protein F5878DRAFT_667994 [Lentinula raphanica]
MDHNHGLCHSNLPPFQTTPQPVLQLSPEQSSFQVTLPQSNPPTTPRSTVHPAFPFPSPYPCHPAAYNNQQWIQYHPQPSHTHQAVLIDSPSLNSSTQISSPPRSHPAPSNANRGRSCKRHTESSGQSRNVHQRTNDPSQENHVPQTETASTSGAGPITSRTAETTRPPPDHPAYSDNGVFKSAIQKSQGPSNISATDVWFFIAPSHTKDAQVSQLPHQIYSDLPKKSEGEWLICKWCTDMSTHRGIWRNNTSNTTNIRAHLRTHHYNEYHDLVIKNKLKHWENLLRENPQYHSLILRRADEPILLSKFSELLVRWIIVDDQSLNVVDCQEFRDLLLYIGTELTENDIPHRTKIIDIIFEQFDKQFNDIWKKPVGKYA